MGLISPKNKEAIKTSHGHVVKSSLSNNKSAGRSKQKHKEGGIRIPVGPSMSKQKMASINTINPHNPLMKSKERAESAPLLVGISQSNTKTSQKKKSKKKKKMIQQ